MEANGHLLLGLFSLKDFYYFRSGDRHTAEIPQRDYKIDCQIWKSQYPGLCSHNQTQRTSASVSSWQNRASCFQDNVLKWLIKGFLDITSPCEAIFWWLNYKWIRNIWNEFPLGLAKHTSDLIPSRIFERWFWVFVESNMASLSPVPFALSGSLGRGQRLVKVFFVLAFVPKLPDLYTNAEFLHLRVSVDWVYSTVVSCIATLFLSSGFWIVQEVSF